MNLEYDIHFLNQNLNENLSARDASVSPFLKHNHSNRKIVERDELLRKKILRVLENHKAEYARILEQDMPEHLRKQAI